MMDAGDAAWAHIEDPISDDFFGFEFDFTDYADDEWFDSDGSLKDAALSSTATTHDDHSTDHIPQPTNSGSTVNKRNSIGEEEDASARLKRQKIEQYASAMRKPSNSTSAPSPTLSNTNTIVAALSKGDSKITTSAVGANSTTVKRTKQKKAKPAAKSDAFMPPVIAQNDIRRMYTKYVINGFNSCDIRIIKKTIEDYAIHDMIAVHRYEGIQNPYGRNITRVKGRDAYIDMWSALVKSAPDFFFDVLETRTFYDPSTFHIIVASKFSWFGTRVMDVKYTTKVTAVGDGGGETVADTSSTDHNHHRSPASSAPATTSTTRGDVSVPTDTAAATAYDESIFSSATSNEFDTEVAATSGIPASALPAAATSAGKFYVDAIPSRQKLQMSCEGTFLVYIYTNYYQDALERRQQQQQPPNAHGETDVPPLPIDAAFVDKIFKLEFVYMSSAEKLVQEQLPVASSSSASTTNTTS